MRPLPLLLAISTYALTHLLFLGTSPGLHYDEAWAANFALRIAEVPGFWPLEAMSPQTHAWHHYWVAGWFRLFGPSVEVFRLAHVALGLAGVLLLARALARHLDDPRIAPAFVALAALQPALVANHRFAIELTSFHALCFGGMVHFALARGRFSPFLASVFAALGIGSHIFFIAPALAFVMTTIVASPSPPLKARLSVTFGALLSLPFVWKLQTALPEKDKAHALLAVFLLAIACTWILPRLPSWSRIRPALAKVPLLIGVLATPLVAFLIEGNWAALGQTGLLRFNWLAGWGLVPVIVCGIWWLRHRHLQPDSLRSVALFWGSLALCTLAVAPKPTGRYFETLFLASLALFVPILVRAPLRVTASFLTWPLVLGANLLAPAATGAFVNREFRLLVFHDQSRDFLPKQQALAPLARKGCRREQVDMGDPRIAEGIAFILEAGRKNVGCDGRMFTARSGDSSLVVTESEP